MEKTGKFLIEAMDLDNAGNASSTIKKILIEEGISKQIIKRVSIAVYEAEINVVIHSYGGTCTYFIDDQKIRIIFEDTGPGIVDIEQALEPGFSTANNQAIYYGFGAGMGLMNIKNASDEFDITSSPAYDQTFQEDSQFFETISQIVDDIFNNYIVKGEQIQPLFATYCDGINTTCSGLSQWGSVDLAKQGFSPIEILKRYYGDDIEIIYNAPVSPNVPSYPGFPFRLGSAGNFVRQLKVCLLYTSPSPRDRG